jgi:AraC family transcriptional regulator
MNVGARAEYTRRMHRVLAHIDARLDQALPLAELAEVAYFSPFHFHRLFTAWMGETVGDYLRRRRLEVAAQRLMSQPALPVLELALGVGFGSGEAFTRAFKERFGCTPTAWRVQGQQRRKSDQADSKLDQAAPAAPGDPAAPNPPETVMNVQVIDRPAVHLAYLRRTGPYGDGVAQFWQQQVAPWMQANGLTASPRYGISHDDPFITAPERCRYDAGAEVPAGFAPTAPGLVAPVPGGRCASLYFKGTAAEIGAAWTALMRDWLPGSGMQLDARPCFEFYRPEYGYDPATGAFECDIVVPLKPL